MSTTKDTSTSTPLHEYHRFMDEAGDTTFYRRKGQGSALGMDGVSKGFMLGMLKIKEPLAPVRARVVDLQREIAEEPFFNSVPSVRKRIQAGGYFLHAKDDIPEIRMKTFELIRATNLSFEAFSAQKIPAVFNQRHHGNAEEFYADILSHLLKNKFQKYDRLVLNVAERGKSTSNANLMKSLKIATSRYLKKPNSKPPRCKMAFNIQTPTREPLLNLADYCCWAVQRVFERGETRFYEHLIDRISLVVDLYDSDGYGFSSNHYKAAHPLRSTNKYP